MEALPLPCSPTSLLSPKDALASLSLFLFLDAPPCSGLAPALRSPHGSFSPSFGCSSIPFSSFPGRRYPYNALPSRTSLSFLNELFWRLRHVDQVIAGILVATLRSRSNPFEAPKWGEDIPSTGEGTPLLSLVSFSRGFLRLPTLAALPIPLMAAEASNLVALQLGVVGGNVGGTGH